jgi:hypothetical protein
MTSSSALVCDGCGQTATAEHISRRLQRLEWTTRYRPVHISTLLLGAFSPQDEKDFLYAPGGEFHGEAAHVLDAARISIAGKAAEVVHAEFQRAGFFLTHVLECPLDNYAKQGAEAAGLLRKRLQPVAIRIRRSLKPKRVMVITEELTPVVEDMGCPVLLDHGKPFPLESGAGENGPVRLREAIAISVGG